MRTPLARPPFDPQIQDVFDQLQSQVAGLTAEQIAGASQASFAVDELAGFDVDRREMVVSGYRGMGIALSVFTPKGLTSPAPAFYNIHGGGMVAGDRLTGISMPLRWATAVGAVVVSVEYRLAPASQDPIPVEDCYAGLVWVSENAGQLGIDPTAIIVVGGSAGGGLAAGTVLLARDRNGPAVLGQMLICPMLDDRDVTVSTHQFDGTPMWDRKGNIRGWSALLGDRYGTDEVSIYAAPARSTDLSGLPPTFIDCGSAEVFRDEDAAYALQIWADGGAAEFHVWPGGAHAWDALIPGSAMAEQSAKVRESWIRRLLEARPLTNDLKA